MEDGICARVEFAYKQNEADELTLEVGDIVEKCIEKEDGRYKKLQLYSSSALRNW